MNCDFEYVGSFRKCEPITLGTAGLISAGIMATGATAQGIAAAKTTDIFKIAIHILNIKRWKILLSKKFHRVKIS